MLIVKGESLLSYCTKNKNQKELAKASGSTMNSSREEAEWTTKVNHNSGTSVCMSELRIHIESPAFAISLPTFASSTPVTSTPRSTSTAHSTKAGRTVTDHISKGLPTPSTSFSTEGKPVSSSSAKPTRSSIKLHPATIPSERLLIHSGDKWNWWSYYGDERDTILYTSLILIGNAFFWIIILYTIIRIERSRGKRSFCSLFVYRIARNNDFLVVIPMGNSSWNSRDSIEFCYYFSASIENFLPMGCIRCL